MGFERKVDRDVVYDLLAQKKTATEIAEIMGVSLSAISYIVHQRTPAMSTMQEWAMRPLCKSPWTDFVLEEQ